MDYLVALVPSVGTGILFFIAIRAIVRADRKERDAMRKLEQESLSKTASPSQATE
ncbi:hypothetical protein [Georgenia alba]|uniref:Lysyl-tRNA synthetase n=1 Tax=Georgenia alba TaxID=2233858 RepID=A0ABW2Q779_9MICO